MESRPIASGVGLLTGRIGNSFKTIEKYFPLPEIEPKRFDYPLYPRFTDSIFIRAIYELAGKKITLKDLSRTASFHRLDKERLEILIRSNLKECIDSLEPRFTEFPEIEKNFINSARRYIEEPFPEFEIDFIYGEADIYHNKKLIEMKSYSVMTMQDLIHARNQVLLYACLNKYIGNFQKPINEIEVINALTNEIWTWDFSKFYQSGEADRFYWTVIVPMIANNDLTDENIYIIRNIYEENISGLDLFSKIIKDKYSKTIFNLHRKLKEREKQLQIETKSRRMIITKQRNNQFHIKRDGHCEIDYECLRNLFI